MGPAIILDKSAFQALSEAELHFLYKYYYVVIPPILILEIIGDISKHDDIRVLKQQVVYLANKFGSQSTSHNAPHNYLIEQELEGFTITTDNRPIVEGEWVKRPDGKIGYIINPTPEDEAIERWRAGVFKRDEELYSRIWRRATKEYDLDGLKNKVQPIFSSMPKVKSSDDLVLRLDVFLSNVGNGIELFYWTKGIFDLDDRIISDALNKFNVGEYSSFSQFAPYTYYCLRLTLLFYLGLVSGIVTTRATNILDLEYLYYLPFCVVMCSGDHLHKTLCPLLISSDQVFVQRSTLKADLAQMAQAWLSLDEDTRKDEWQRRYGDTPPEDENSITYHIWENSDRWGTKQRSPAQESIPSSPLFEPDFIEIRRDISIYAPCPCGSGKKFKDCHYQDLNK